ncbi:hypothetical protein SAMN02910370_02092 [Lachnospiraceae bacterium XPB1003]|nr:hypothetical protein SAMN02910370_02092 [Lachnospiraceae bacterium XPB1003]
MIKSDHRKKCRDHEGRSFDSIEDMCRFWKISSAAYQRRIKVYKWSKKKALTFPAKNNGGVACRDFEGNEFRSISTMCAYYGVYRKTYLYRVAHGWTVKDALLSPARGGYDDKEA